REFAAHLRSGTLRAPYLALLYGKEAQSRSLLQRAAGRLEIEAVPVGVARQLFEDSPFAASEKARTIRELLGRWRGEITGGLQGQIEAPLLRGGPGESPGTLLAR